MQRVVASSWHLPEAFNVRQIRKSLPEPENGETDVLILTSIEAPDRPSGRKPCHIVCVIDTSGSMAAEATTQSEDGKRESNGLTQLDVVGHSVKTIIACMGPEDTLGIVEYSSKASVVLHPTKMNDDGKRAANKAVEELTPDGSTNLWDGLKTGLKQLAVTMEKADEEANASVLLLTDGVPNIHPPCGYLPSLQKFLKKNPDPRRSIHTFGFGYNLRSKLLCELADMGNGSYAFIPDAGLVGTVFVHAASNILASSFSAGVLDYKLKHGAKLVGVLGFPDLDAKNNVDDDDYEDDDDKDDDDEDGDVAMVPASRSVEVGIGPILYGQRKATLAILRVPSKAIEQKKEISQYLKVQLKTSVGWTVSKWRPEANRKKRIVKDDVARALAVQGLFSIMETGTTEHFGRLENAKKGLQETVKSVEAVYALGETKNISKFGKRLLVDLNGQVAEAVSKTEYWTRWGIHYLPSLARAHRLQLTNNFKDPGVQKYGGKTFERFREKCDELFLSLPPPKPAYSYEDDSFSGTSSPVSTVQMSAYYNQAGGCVSGDSMVHMADGGLTPMSALRPGAVVKTGFVSTNGSELVATIKCIVKTTVSEEKMELVRVGDGLKLTAYHPIFDTQVRRWRFPNEFSKGRVYIKRTNAFLLEETDSDHPKAILVNGVPVIALGHGVQDEDCIARHQYFGSRQKEEGMSRTMKGWNIRRSVPKYIYLRIKQSIKLRISHFATASFMDFPHYQKKGVELERPIRSQLNRFPKSPVREEIIYDGVEAQVLIVAKGHCIVWKLIDKTFVGDRLAHTWRLSLSYSLTFSDVLALMRDMRVKECSFMGSMTSAIWFERFTLEMKEYMKHAQYVQIRKQSPNSSFLQDENLNKEYKLLSEWRGGYMDCYLMPERRNVRGEIQTLLQRSKSNFPFSRKHVRMQKHVRKHVLGFNLVRPFLAHVLCVIVGTGFWLLFYVLLWAAGFNVKLSTW